MKKQLTTPRRTESHFPLRPSQAREFFDRDHRIILNLGGFGSGKTALLAPLMLASETELRHGLFANSYDQLMEGIFPVIEPWFDEAGIEWTFGSKPPRVWQSRWERDGIRYPSRGPRARNTLILETGHHFVLGGLGNRKFKRFKGYEFGKIFIEEITEQDDAEVLNFMLPRVRCKDGDYCRHHHCAYLHGNPPPPTQPHWIRRWIKEQNRAARDRSDRGLKPHFLHIQSSTRENVKAIGNAYVETLLASMDADHARALVDGYVDEVIGAKSYRAFSNLNKLPTIAYDRHRPLHISFDFNVDPACAVIGCELEDDEVPQAQRGKGLIHCAAIGEVYIRGGMDAAMLTLNVIRGERGTWPAEFKGLKNHRSRIYVYGDASGSMRRVESRDLRSAWSQVSDIMSANVGTQWELDVPKANPSVYDSLFIMNGKMRADNGDISYWVSEAHCPHLIEDYENVVPEADGSTWISKKDELLTHLSDAERYRVARRYSSRNRFTLRDLKQIGTFIGG